MKIVHTATIRKILEKTVSFFGVSKIRESTGFIIRHSQPEQKKIMRKFRNLGYRVKKLDKKNIAVFPKKGK